MSRLTGKEATKRLFRIQSARLARQMSDSDYRYALKALKSLGYHTNMHLTRGKIDPRDKRVISAGLRRHAQALKVHTFEGSARLKAPTKEHEQAMLAHGYGRDAKGRFLVPRLGAHHLRIGKEPGGNMAIVRTGIRANHADTMRQALTNEALPVDKFWRLRAAKLIADNGLPLTEDNYQRYKNEAVGFIKDRNRRVMSTYGHRNLPSKGKDPRDNVFKSYQFIFLGGGAEAVTKMDEIFSRDYGRHAIMAYSNSSSGIWNMERMTYADFVKYLDDKGIDMDDDYNEKDPRHWIQQALVDHLILNVVKGESIPYNGKR